MPKLHQSSNWVELINECLLKHAILFFPQIKASTPVLMCSVPGYDASSRVDDLAAEMSKQITSIAIGKKKNVQIFQRI